MKLTLLLALFLAACSTPQEPSKVRGLFGKLIGEPTAVRPTTLTEIPAALDVTKDVDLTTRLRDLAKYCEAGEGLVIDAGPTYTIPRCADGTNKWPTCLATAQDVVLHSHPTLGTPEVKDRDGKVTGGDRIMVTSAAVDAKLRRLCVPAVTERTDRAVAAGVLAPLVTNGTVRFIREIPEGWVAK